MQSDRSVWKRALVAIVAVIFAFAMVACGDDDSGSEPESQETEAPSEEPTEETEAGAGAVTFTATDFAFDLPASLPAGPASFTLQNDGKQPHQLVMAKLSDDAPPIDKLIKMRDADKFLEEDLTGNKPPHAAPGETAQALEVELT